MDPIFDVAERKNINKDMQRDQNINPEAHQEMRQDLPANTYREKAFGDYTVIEKANASVRRQMHEQEEAVINQNAVTVRTRTSVLADMSEEQNRKKHKDSPLMTKIKAAAAEIEDLLELSVPLDQEKLDISISALEMNYDVLISYCNEYEKKHAGKKKGIAASRLGFVKELRLVTEREKENIRSAAMFFKNEHQNENELTNWSEIVLRARSQAVGVISPDYDYIEKKAGTDSAVALSRIAEYMGAADAFLKRDYVSVNGRMMVRSPKLDNKKYKSLKTLAEKEPEAIKKYSVTAFRKLHAVQVVEEMLGLRFKPEEILVKYKTVKENVNNEEKKCAVIEDLIVETPGQLKFVRDMKKDYKKSGVIIERGMANRIAAMNPEVMSLLFTDLIDSSERKTLVNNIKSMQKRLYTKDSRILGENDWINFGDTLLSKKIKKVAKEGKPGYVTGDMFSECADTLDFGELRHTTVKTGVQEDPAQKQQKHDQIMKWYEKRLAKRKVNAKIDTCLKLSREADQIIMRTAEMRYMLYREESERPTFGWHDRTQERVFAKVPSPEDIKQGSVGNCYLMSALTALAKNNPTTIMSMIDDMGEFALVRFPGKTPIPVSKKTVMIKLPGETESKEHYSKGALWVALIEKAYSQLHYEKNKHDKGALRDLSFKYRSKTRSVDMNDGSGRSLHSDLKYSIEVTEGGFASEALSNLTGQKYVGMWITPITADNMATTYTNMWKKAEAGDAQMGIDGFSAEERYLREVLADALKKEIAGRYSKIYEGEQGTTRTSAYRNVSIENIKDTLLDIKNWTYQKEDKDHKSLFKDYKSLYKDIKNRFHRNDDTFSDAKLMARLSFLAARLELASDSLKTGFEHETVGKKQRYSKRAMKMAAFLKAALNHGVLTAGTNKYINGKGEGLNSEHVVEGMVEGHAYTIVAYNENKETGQIILSMINPWAQGGMQYTKTTDANGKMITVGRQAKPETGDDGSFDIELNDFLRFCNRFDVSQEVLDKPEVKPLYDKLHVNVLNGNQNVQIL